MADWHLVLALGRSAQFRLDAVLRQRRPVRHAAALRAFDESRTALGVSRLEELAESGAAAKQQATQRALEEAIAVVVAKADLVSAPATA